MFARCMVIMRGLKRNIAGIKSPSAFKSEIPGLEKTIKECISPPLGYACRYWSTHLVLCVESAQADSSYDVFSEFLHCYYLYWLEACSLIGIIDGVVNAHYAVLQACRTLGGRFAGLTPFLVDCRRFALTYAACVDMAPLQLYHSALAVAPTKSLVKKAYTQDLGASLMVRHGVRSEWAPCLDSFKGHGSRVALAVAFSTSGDYFITGGQDTMLRMWRPTTRTMILSFDGHTNPVVCVAFSPDGTHVASGSSDRDVRVWQVSSGECVQTLKGHTDFVYSVAYSADGLRILSAAKMGEVKLWDPSDGRCILTLDKTIIDTAQAGISPDGGVIARGDGSSLVLYDVSSATKEVFEFPALVQAATFSPDGRYVAARSDHVIRVWRFADRSLVRSIDVSGNRLSSQLAFSRDGAHIGCGLENGSVYLWHVASEAPPRVLCGHTRWVYNLSWSPNGLEVISVSSDGTVRVWDITQPSTDAEDVASLYRPTTIGPVRFVLARHTRAVLLLHLPSLKIDAADCSAFPCALPEGAPVLTPLMDMVDVWDAVPRVNGLSELTRTHPWTAISGRQHVNFAGISIFSPEVPVEISSDGSLVAYPSSTPRNYVVDICDLRTGKVLTSLAGHTDHVRSISFSPDGTLIATGSSDNSVKVWDCANGVMLHSHDQHAGRVEALVFSSDGHLVASASDDETVHVFEATTGRVVQVLESHRAQVMKVAFTTKNTRILSLDNVHWLYIWDVATGTHIYDISLEDDSWIYSLHFSPDGTGVLIPGEHPPEPLAQSLRKPCDRTWPVYAVSREGWLYEKGPGFTARLCWLPSEWRTIFPLGNGQLCTPHRAVVLDVSQLPDYVQM